VISAGGSMGGTVSGLAVTLDARRHDGAPLFDYWVGISPLTDLLTDFAVADALAPLRPYYGTVIHDFETEAGGSPAQAPFAYLERSLITQAGNMAAAGLKGAAIFQAAGDFDITPEQEPLMVSELVAHHVPTSDFIDTVAAPGEGDASFDGEIVDFALYTLGGNTDSYQQLLAGHQGPYLRNAATAAVGDMLAGQWVGTLGVSAVAGPLP
jgi:acetyl esterase/lipase